MTHTTFCGNATDSVGYLSVVRITVCYELTEVLTKKVLVLPYLFDFLSGLQQMIGCNSTEIFQRRRTNVNGAG